MYCMFIGYDRVHRIVGLVHMFVGLVYKFVGLVRQQTLTVHQQLLRDCPASVFMIMLQNYISIIYYIPGHAFVNRLFLKFYDSGEDFPMLQTIFCDFF